MTLTLPREVAHRFRAAARKCHPGRKGPDPPVRVSAAGGTLTLFASFGEVGLALAVPGPSGRPASAVLPPGALDTPDPLGVPVRCGPGSGDPGEDAPAPPPAPEAMSEVPPEFLAALHEAGRTAAREPGGRYALTRLQVRGKAGQVAGTDARQALVWGGFAFPFGEDLLVPAVPVFGLKDVAELPLVRVGRTNSHLVVAAGPWTVWLRAEAGGRYPDVEAAVPRSRAAAVLELTDAGAAALLDALARLPGAEGDLAPAVLDLGPEVAVRASARADAHLARVAVPGLTAAGPPVTVAVDRRHLARAVRLGFRSVRFAGPDRPWVARDGTRTYLAAALDPAASAGPDPRSDTAPQRVPQPLMEDPMPPTAQTNGHTAPDPGDPDPLAEAEALKSALAEAQARAARLVAALRGHRKQRRTVESALASLRSLRLD